MKTILVSGASGVVGYGVLKSLRKSTSEYKLIGTTIYDDSVAPAFCDIFEKAPRTDSPKYVQWLCSIIEKYAVDLLVPGIEADMLLWNQERAVLAKTGVTLLLNNPDLIELCADKWEFYDKVKEADPTYLIESKLEGSFDELKAAFGLPFILKPRRGFASKGIVIVDSEDTFLQHQHNLGKVLMAQPIVGNNNEEYTISAFFSKSSELLCHMGLKRKLSSEGYTEKAQVTNVPGVEDAINAFAKRLQPVGPTNFQFRVENEKLKLLEINPRISSATSIRAAFGYNESVMSAEYFLNDTVPAQPEIKKGYAVRYVEDYVFYDSNNI